MQNRIPNSIHIMVKALSCYENKDMSISIILNDFKQLETANIDSKRNHKDFKSQPTTSSVIFPDLKSDDFKEVDFTDYDAKHQKMVTQKIKCTKQKVKYQQGGVSYDAYLDDKKHRLQLDHSGQKVLARIRLEEQPVVTQIDDNFTKGINAIRSKLISLEKKYVTNNPKITLIIHNILIDLAKLKPLNDVDPITQEEFKTSDDILYLSTGHRLKRKKFLEHHLLPRVEMITKLSSAISQIRDDEKLIAYLGSKGLKIYRTYAQIKPIVLSPKLINPLTKLPFSVLDSLNFLKDLRAHKAIPVSFQTSFQKFSLFHAATLYNFHTVYNYLNEVEDRRQMRKTEFLSKIQNKFPTIKEIKNADADEEQYFLLSRDSNQKHILHYAAQSDAIEIFTTVEKKSESKTILDDKDKTPLHYAAEFGSIKIFSYLVNKNLNNLFLEDKEKNTPIDLAIKNKQLDIIRDCIERPEFITRACELKKWNLITNLLKHPGSLNKDSIIFLYKRILNNIYKKDIQRQHTKDEKIIEKEAKKYEEKDFFGTFSFPIHLAILRNYEEEINMLNLLSQVEPVSHEIKLLINKLDTTGKTPLHVAVEFNSPMINKLLECGANPFIEDRNKKLPIDIAINQKNLKLIQLHSAIPNFLTDLAKMERWDVVAIMLRVCSNNGNIFKQEDIKFFTTNWEALNQADKVFSHLASDINDSKNESLFDIVVFNKIFDIESKVPEKKEIDTYSSNDEADAATDDDYLDDETSLPSLSDLDDDENSDESVIEKPLLNNNSKFFKKTLKKDDLDEPKENTSDQNNLENLRIEDVIKGKIRKS